MNSHRTHWLAERWIAWRWLWLVLGLLAMAVSFPASQRLEFDRSLEKMFASDHPALDSYRKLKRTFGGDQIVAVAYHDPDVLSADGMARLKQLQSQLAKVPGVEAAISLRDSPLGDQIILPGSEPLLEFFEGLVLGTNRETTAVMCFLLPEEVIEKQTSSTRPESVAEIRRIAQQFNPQSVVAGEPVMVVDGFHYLEEDGWLLGWSTTILMVAVILFFFRSVRWMIIPFVVVQAALIWTKAALVWNGLQLSMVSSMLTAIVTVIGIATVVHLIVRFRDHRLEGKSPKTSLLLAFALLSPPIFWACTTDAVGFASLTISHVGPIQSFGVMMALGAMLTFVAVCLFVPGGSLIGTFDAGPRKAWGEEYLTTSLQNLAHSLYLRPRIWGIVATFVVVVCVLGHMRLEVETDFTKNFREETPVVQSYHFVENNLGGAGVWDVFLPAPEQLDTEYLQRIRKLETRLRNEVTFETADGATQPGLTKVVSVVDAFDAFDKAYPVAKWVPISGKLELFRNQVPPLARALLGTDPQTDQRYYRIMLRALEQQPADAKLAIINQVRTIVEDEFPQENHVTGYYVLLATLIDSLLEDQWTTFAAATIGIGLMMAVIFRSILVALISLIPNALPIFMVLGLMGHLGLKINMGTVMIAAVSMGLSIDSSIHYLSRLRSLMADGHSFREASANVHQSVGLAMIFSCIALIIGFLALVWSHFIPTVYFGILVSLSMLGGLMGNLVLLPLLLKPLYHQHSAQEQESEPPPPHHMQRSHSRI